MFKLHVILAISSVLLATIRTVDSIDCYKCFSTRGLVDGKSYHHPDCERGSSSNITRGPCDEAEGKYCYKVEGLGKEKSEPMVARGCTKDFLDGFKNLTGTGEHLEVRWDNRASPFKIVGPVYVCKTNLCNASNGLSSPVLMLAAVSGFSMFFKSRFALV